MGVTNEELVEKTITAANTLASSGKLNPKQADRFLDYVFDETVLSKVVRQVRFTNESMDIDKIGVGQRVTVPAAEAVDPGVRKGVSTSKLTLTPKEVMVPVEISDTFKEINLEGPNVVSHIMQTFARQMANDLEELHVHGRTAGPLVAPNFLSGSGSTTDLVVDTFLALYNGYLELATGGNVVDFAGAALSANTWSQMLRNMPSKYKKDKRMLRFLCATEVEEMWRERVSTRATATGDMALTSQNNITAFGVELFPMPLMQFHVPKTHVEAFTGSGTTITLDFQPIVPGSVKVINNANAGSVPQTPYVDPTDYTVNATTGVITHAGGGSSIGTTETVRIEYEAMPQIILTTLNNLVLAIGRDVRMEKDRDIYRRADQFAITAKVDVQIEQLEAVVLGTNISDAL